MSSKKTKNIEKSEKEDESEKIPKKVKKSKKDVNEDKENGESSEPELIDLRPKVSDNKKKINVKIIEKLEEYVKLSGLTSFRKTAYMNAIIAIKGHDKEIKSGKEAQKIKGVGKSSAEKIDLILKDESIIEKTEEGELCTVMGIGPANAKKFIKDHDIHSVAELKKICNSQNVESSDSDEDMKKLKERYIKLNLTTSQCLGIKYYDDLLKKIPREEIDYYKENIFGKIKVSNYKSNDKLIKYDIVGSYRRGAKESGDIDIIYHYGNIWQIINFITSLEEEQPSGQSCKNPVKVKPSGQGCKDKLVQIINITTANSNKYMGILIHKKYNIARRIDIKIFNATDIPQPTALLYFTGSKQLNILMRQIAKKKDYTLNEYSLTNNKSGDTVKINCEKDIFDFLGIKYLEPTERNI